MFVVKKEFLNVGAKVILMDPNLVKYNKKNEINLDCAGQSELKLLFDINHPAVEEVKKTKTGVE